MLGLAAVVGTPGARAQSNGPDLLATVPVDVMGELRAIDAMPSARRGYRSRIALKLVEGDMTFDSEESSRCQAVSRLERCVAEVHLNQQRVERRTRLSMGPITLAEQTEAGDGNVSSSHIQTVSFSGRLPHAPGERWSFSVRGTDLVTEADGSTSTRHFIDSCSGDGRTFHLPPRLAAAGPATAYQCNVVSGEPLFRGIYLIGAGLFVDARALDPAALRKGENPRSPPDFVLTNP